MKNNKLLIEEARACFDYFCDNIKKDDFYGLMPDVVPKRLDVCSIAATGFAFAAFAIGADLGFANKADMEAMCVKSLDTLTELETEKGFYYHFYDGEGKRYNSCEVSTIDTALLIAGALTAAEYFGGDVKRKAYFLYDRIDWNYFVDKSRNLLYMAKYDSGFHAWWDVYAEQLIIYVLGTGASNEDFRLDDSLFYGFKRLWGSYSGIDFIYSWFGSIFTHQFSHVFVDFRNITDRDGINWFENSQKATLAARKFCIDNSARHKGYGENSWGLTACACSYGYEGRYGSPPSGNGNIENISDGTIAPAAALGSVMFTPDVCLAALKHYKTIDGLCGEYGLKDAFNADDGWIFDGYISIDKGITLASAANYLNDTVNNYFGKSVNVQNALKRLGFKKSGGHN